LLRRFDLTGQVPTTATIEQAFAAAELHVPIVQFAGPDGGNRTA
jgi:hypothetical protein